MENTMIQPLRRYHRIALFALSVLLPVLFGAGLIARRPLINVEANSDRINLKMPNGTVMVADARELWGKAVDDPDLLVYWTENETQLAAPAANAQLLGSLESGRHGVLRVPRGGYLTLYSLAYQKAVAQARVPKEMP